MSKNDGGPAFPRQPIYRMPDGVALISEQGGMTLRDYFAAKALVALIAADASRRPHPDGAKGYTAGAYLLADAMLAARDK